MQCFAEEGLLVLFLSESEIFEVSLESCQST